MNLYLKKKQNADRQVARQTGKIVKIVWNTVKLSLNSIYHYCIIHLRYFKFYIYRQWGRNLEKDD